MTNLRRRLRKIENQVAPTKGPRYLVKVLPAGVDDPMDEYREYVQELDRRGLLPPGPVFIPVDQLLTDYPFLKDIGSSKPLTGKGPDGSRKSA